jgi:5-methylcytosine-specific restriction endonuclease McrA
MRKVSVRRPLRLHRNYFITRKRLTPACLVCGEGRPEALTCHRITPGADGGRYEHANTVTLCATCHALLHAGKLSIGPRRQAYGDLGPWAVEVTVDGETTWRTVR